MIPFNCFSVSKNFICVMTKSQLEKKNRWHINKEQQLTVTPHNFSFSTIHTSLLKYVGLN